MWPSVAEETGEAPISLDVIALWRKNHLDRGGTRRPHRTTSQSNNNNNNNQNHSIDEHFDAFQQHLIRVVTTIPTKTDNINRNLRRRRRHFRTTTTPVTDDRSILYGIWRETIRWMVGGGMDAVVVETSHNDNDACPHCGQVDDDDNNVMFEAHVEDDDRE
jgi:hypothetical protein